MIKKIILSAIIGGLFFCIFFFGPRKIQTDKEKKALTVKIIRELNTDLIQSIGIYYEDEKYTDAVITDRKVIEEFVFDFKKSQWYSSHKGRLGPELLRLTFNKTDGSTIKSMVVINEHSALILLITNQDSSYTSPDDFLANEYLKNRIERLRK